MHWSLRDKTQQLEMAGVGLFMSKGLMHLSVDEDYLQVDPYSDAVTAGPRGLARLKTDNVFDGTNNFQDVICTSLDIVSDNRTKQNITKWGSDDPKLQDMLDQLQVCEFSYKHDVDERRRIGLLAQDAPNFSGRTTGDDHMTIDYLGIIGLLVSQVQRLSKRVQVLEDGSKVQNTNTIGECHLDPKSQ